MKYALAIAFLVAPLRLMGGESGLVTTYQPLDGLGSGKIFIAPVVCHDWYGHSGQPTPIGLISAANIPPTNNPKEATENLNVAHACGIRFICGDIQVVRELTLDATGFTIPNRFGHPREEIARACLECLRRCLPEFLLDTPVVLKAAEPDKTWLSEIVREFNAHNRREVFFVPTS